MMSNPLGLQTQEILDNMSGVPKLYAAATRGIASCALRKLVGYKSGLRSKHTESAFSIREEVNDCFVIVRNYVSIIQEETL